MPVAQHRLTSPSGLSFDIAELILIRSWAEAIDLRMTIHLDFAVDGNEYEEVLCFQSAGRPFYHWIMWRDAETVFVQPLMGRQRCYSSVADAVDAMAAARNELLVDIRPIDWP